MTAANATPSPEAKARHAAQVAWRECNPQAYWAHAALRSGIRRGLVTPEPCVICGEPKAEAHHPDYDRPLAVQWLCRQHHKQAHAEQRRGKA